MYVSPRPLDEAFNLYYQEAPSSIYWATTFYKETEEARREKLWKPKAMEIQHIVQKFSSVKNSVVVDVGGGYGLFADEIKKLSGWRTIVIEPGPHLASVCRKNGHEVVESFLEEVTIDDLPFSPKTFTSFELFEHLHDPKLFLGKLSKLMSSGDIFIFTTLSESELIFKRFGKILSLYPSSSP